MRTNYFRVLQRLKKFSLKLSPEKCQFFRMSIKYLGYVVSVSGVETDPDKIAALTMCQGQIASRSLSIFSDLLDIIGD